MAIKGDFISFTYNGVHSTELGIVRVSSSNRYNDSLLPMIQDKTNQVPGNDGTYFFGSNYTQRPITIDIAFDEVTEDQIRLMRATFGDRMVHQLTFDDEPYKVYYAKVTGTPQIKYIPFGSPRIYKGEGTFTFTCFDPFAHCPNDYKYLNQYIAGNSPTPSWYKINNKDEWNLSANLLSAQGTYDTYVTATGFKLYNPGDVAADFYFIIPISATISGIKITNSLGDLDSHTLLLKNTPITVKGTDTHICFNSKMNLIQGYKDGARTGNIYNEYIGNGHWFQIPVSNSQQTYYFVPINYSGVTPVLKYDYLYY